jgi:hypothetical protein
LVDADHLYGTDSRWWAHHISDISRDFDGRCWTQSVQWDKQDPAEWGIICLIGDTAKPGLSTDPAVVRTGSNSGYAAINLALNLHHHTGRRACERILLLGYDMSLDGSKRHWFGDHPQPMNMASNYKNFISAYNTITPSDYGIEIINVSRRTALTCFPRQSLDDL